jgi:uncharacterized membrane protein/protein-disulfide isomerase
MTRRAYFLLLAFALLGLCASAASAWVHYQLLNDPLYSSFCDINSTVSCAQAYMSSYGSLFGTPVALFGLLWFVAVLGLLVAGRPGAGRFSENVPGYVFALSTIGLAMVLYLAYGSFFVLQAVCIFCVLTYVAVIGLFVVSGAQTKFPMTSLPQRVLHDLRTAFATPVALAALVIFVAGAATAIAFFPKDSGAAAGAEVTQDERGEVERWFDSQPRTIVPVGDTKGAAVVIVKFNDYQCPPCKQTYLNYKPILMKYEAQAPGKVLFITKHFPIDPECNVNTPQGTHVLACEAAGAVILAQARNTHEQLEDWIFANQQSLTGEALKTAVKNLAGVPDYETKYSQTLAQIKSDIALGKLLGVSATPTFFINGVRVSGGLQPQYLDAIIAHELKKSQTNQTPPAKPGEGQN